MERRKTVILPLIVSFISLILESKSQYRATPTITFPSFPAIRPLCVSQFALVNHACSALPYAPVPPPSPPLPPSPPSPSPPTNGHRHRHRHHHNHHQESSSSPDPALEECCRWLKEFDSQCLCDLLPYLCDIIVGPCLIRHSNDMVKYSYPTVAKLTLYLQGLRRKAKDSV